MTGKSKGKEPKVHEPSRRQFLGWLGILAVAPHIALEPQPPIGLITIQHDRWSNHGVGSHSRNGLPWCRQNNHVPPGHPPR